jgi:hypothetical protein
MQSVEPEGRTDRGIGTWSVGAQAAAGSAPSLPNKPRTNTRGWSCGREV